MCGFIAFQPKACPNLNEPADEFRPRIIIIILFFKFNFHLFIIILLVIFFVIADFQPTFTPTSNIIFNKNKRNSFINPECQNQFKG